MLRRTRLLFLAALAWSLSGCALDLSRLPRAPGPQATAVALRAPTSPLRAGQSAQLEAVLLTQAGDSEPGRITWTVSDTEIATVTPDGRVIAGTKPGTAMITATSEGLSNSAVVTVKAREWWFSWKEGAVFAFCSLVRCDRIVGGTANQLRAQYDYYRWRNRRRIGFLLGALAAVALGLLAVRRRTVRHLMPA